MEATAGVLAADGVEGRLSQRDSPASRMLPFRAMRPARIGGPPQPLAARSSCPPPSLRCALLAPRAAARPPPQAERDVLGPQLVACARAVCCATWCGRRRGRGRGGRRRGRGEMSSGRHGPLRGSALAAHALAMHSRQFRRAPCEDLMLLTLGMRSGHALWGHARGMLSEGSRSRRTLGRAIGYMDFADVGRNRASGSSSVYSCLSVGDDTTVLSRWWPCCLVRLDNGTALADRPEDGGFACSNLG